MQRCDAAEALARVADLQAGTLDAGDMDRDVGLHRKRRRPAASARAQHVHRAGDAVGREANQQQQAEAINQQPPGLELAHQLGQQKEGQRAQ